MRISLLTAALTLTVACGFFSKNDGPSDAEDDDGDDDDFDLLDCDIRCDSDGIDLSMRASGASEAEVEFLLSAQLIETFSLTQLDDVEWVGYPGWPTGTSFNDCGAEADFVCVIRSASGDEIREAR